MVAYLHGDARMSKRCACCGRVFTEIPANARFQFAGDVLDGWYWDCCKSTLFWPVKE